MTGYGSQDPASIGSSRRREPFLLLTIPDFSFTTHSKCSNIGFPFPKARVRVPAQVCGLTRNSYRYWEVEDKSNATKEAGQGGKW